MTPTRDLSQLEGDRMFLSDGGLETTLIFQHGLDLPLFAARRSGSHLLHRRCPTSA
jgi:hypothetical protein